MADAPKAKMPMGWFGGLVTIAIAGGGAWYYFNKANLEKQAALTAALETATKASQELQQAQAKQQESLKALEEARAKEIAALKSGDAAKIKEAQEAAKRAEAEAAKQAERSSSAKRPRADARKKAQDSAASAAKAPSGSVEPEVRKPGGATSRPKLMPKQEAEGRDQGA